MSNEELLLKIEDLLDVKLEEKLESEVSALKHGQLDVRKKLETLAQKVDKTYDMALDAWGKSTENRKWLETAGV